jgi:hypothetical protein
MVRGGGEDLRPGEGSASGSGGAIPWFRDRLLPAVLALAAIAAAFVVSQTARPSDDAYITFRHVKNLASHGVPAWNVDGPRVLGTTAPAYTAVLALWSRATFTRDIPTAALRLNALLHAGAVLLVFVCAKDLAGSGLVALLCAGLVAFNSVIVGVASQGFENSMLTDVLLGSFLAARHARWAPALALASIAPLVRPEGIAATPIVWGALFVHRAFRPVHFVYFGVIPLAWLVFSLAYYGSPIPQSVAAKRFTPIVFWPYTGEPISLFDRVLHLPMNLWAALKSWGLRIVINGNRLEAVTNPLRMALGAVIGLAVPAVFAYHARTRPAMLIYLLYPFLFVGFYALVGHTSAWYFPSYVAFVLVLVFAGGAAAIRPWVVRARGETAWRAAIVLFAAALFATNRYTYHRGDTDDPRPWIYARDANSGDWSGMERERYRSYRAAAERLNREPGAAEATALISEIGVFGYFFDGRVYDPVGLCSPSAPGYYPPSDADLIDSRGRPFRAANNVVPVRMLEGEQPDYVVNATIYMPHLLEPRSSLRRDYELLDDTSGTAWGEPVLIFARRDRARPAQDSPSGIGFR